MTPPNSLILTLSRKTQEIRHESSIMPLKINKQKIRKNAQLLTNILANLQAMS